MRAGEETQPNPSLEGGKTVEPYVGIMGGLDLPQPTRSAESVPENHNCGQLRAAQPRNALRSCR